ncbi:spherulation-specific family 4 protein [Kribbella sp. NBC_01245]|uniref:spherulation-specific family 4 protein n=1 Tax=Kribbella sp. NBC_01245 TaxID=2903578 RepID=UPI002E2D5706|nr:spherulation-specific family 4 protein [Kribbella sp. NBC_01245]
MTRLAIPWYVHPAEDPGQWTRLAELAGQLAFVVVNIANGPGDADDPYYPAALAALRSSGVHFYGYVDTAYAQRGIVQVAADVRAWLERYDVDGIMFDQVAPGPDGLGYNRMLALIARQAGARCIVANPGVEPCPELPGLFDVTCVFEDEFAAHGRGGVAERTVGPDRLWHLVYGVPADAIDAVLERVEAEGVGLAFVTDRPGPHPWTGLPSSLVGASRC